MPRGLSDRYNLFIICFISEKEALLKFFKKIPAFQFIIFQKVAGTVQYMPVDLILI